MYLIFDAFFVKKFGFDRSIKTGFWNSLVFIM